jgi:hypothetical protein
MGRWGGRGGEEERGEDERSLRYHAAEEKPTKSSSVLPTESANALSKSTPTKNRSLVQFSNECDVRTSYTNICILTIEYFRMIILRIRISPSF